MTPRQPTDPPDPPTDASEDGTSRPPSVQAYLDDVQARLADPGVLARATALARERGLDLDTMTFGDLDDLVNDATASEDAEDDT